MTNLIQGSKIDIVELRSSTKLLIVQPTEELPNLLPQSLVTRHHSAINLKLFRIVGPPMIICYTMKEFDVFISLLNPTNFRYLSS